jgi:DNA-binding CsgD family transcriptional regulator
MPLKTIKNYGQPLILIFGLLCILSFGTFLALILTGTLQYGGRVTEYISWDRIRIARKLENRLEEISQETQALSQTLSRNIEQHLRFLNLSMAELSYHPDTLEWIANEELDLLIPALDKTEITGVFVAFEATIDPHIERAEYSRAGLYIRNLEPIRPGISRKQFFKGFANLAIQKNLFLMSSWDLEFDMRGKDYYTTVVTTYKEDPSLPLSRSYYWSFIDLSSYGEKNPSLFCSIPIISSQGELLGVCGFEMTPFMFREIHNPNSDPQLLCVFAPLKGDKLDSKSGFRSGNPAASGSLDNFVFIDTLETIKLYHNASPYADRQMALAVGMPRREYNRQLFYRNGVPLILLGGGILGGAFFLRGYYRKAYTKKLEEYHAKALPDFKKHGLSKREEEICLLLLKGYTIKEISVQLYIAFATANNHCQSIYRKLGINSRQELFLKFGD